MINEIRDFFDSQDILLADQDVWKFQLYKEELLRWNDKMNLTTITLERDIVVQHFLDSVLLVKLYEPSKDDSILDIGSGAGFPGIPIKIMFPTVKVDLLESKVKKTRFLTRLLRKLSIDDVTVFNYRAEELAHDLNLRESYSIVVTRAVSSLNTIIELSLPFLKDQGKLYVWKTKEQYLQEVNNVENALKLLNGRILTTYEYVLPSKEVTYVLIEIEKLSTVPDKYPRNVGIPEKRPL